MLLLNFFLIKFLIVSFIFFSSFFFFDIFILICLFPKQKNNDSAVYSHESPTHIYISIDQINKCYTLHAEASSAGLFISHESPTQIKN